MLDQIDAAQADTEGSRHLLCRPFFKTVQVKNLELFRINLALHSFQPRGQQVFLPLLLPEKGKMKHHSIRAPAITIKLNEIPVRSPAPAKPWGFGILSPFRRVLVGAFLLGVGTAGARADVVIDWNIAMTDYATPRSPVPLGPLAELQAPVVVSVPHVPA